MMPDAEIDDRLRSFTIYLTMAGTAAVTWAVGAPMGFIAVGVGGAIYQSWRLWRGTRA